MDPIEKQRKIFTIAAVLVFVSVLSLIAVIPGILLDTSPGSLPVQAAIGTLIGMSIHLVVLLSLWRGIRVARRKRKINKEINAVAAFGLLVLGFVLMDGAFAFLEQVLYVSIGMFLVVACDFAAAIVFVSALFLIRTRG